jgi:hypothetical protein
MLVRCWSGWGTDPPAPAPCVVRGGQSFGLFVIDSGGGLPPPPLAGDIDGYPPLTKIDGSP